MYVEDLGLLLNNYRVYINHGNVIGDVDADAVSHPGGNPSIGEASLSLGSGSQLEREADRESASMVALAGSIISALPGGHRYTHT